jgi:hypothetical protein
MAEFEDVSTPEERIVAVFRDQRTAELAAERARSRGALNVTVGGHNDEVRALVGEMREETSESWAGPSVAIYNAEMARHIPAPTAAAAVIGAIVALPLGLLDWGNVTLLGRLVLAAFSGAVGGGTIGFLIGGFIGARRRANLDLAEERGVVVGMQGGNPEATAELVNAGAVRVDRMLGQTPVDTVTSHEDRTPAETVRDQPIPQSEP